MKIGIGTEVHVYQAQGSCDVHTVETLVCFVRGRRVYALLENGCMLNALTLRHWHLPSDCRYRSVVKVNLKGSTEKRTWEVPPSSGRGTPYEVALWMGQDGRWHWSCNCTAGTYQKLCKHVKAKSVEVFGVQTDVLVMDYVP